MDDITQFTRDLELDLASDDNTYNSYESASIATHSSNEYHAPVNSPKKESVNFFDYETFSDYNEIILYTLLFLGLNTSFIINNLSKIKNINSNINLLIRTTIFGTILYFYYKKYNQ
jgi:hypothetical protein